MERTCVIICGGADNPALSHIPTDYAHYVFVGADRGALTLLEAGYTLDIAVGDFDSITEAERQKVATNAHHFTQYPSEKDDTDLELALSLAYTAYPTADYYLFGAIGTHVNRIDHLLANIWLANQPRYQPLIQRLTIVERHSTIRFYTAGTYEIPFVSCDYLSIIATTPLEKLSITQAKYNLPPTDYHYPCALISNEFVDQMPIMVRFNRGTVMIMMVNETTH